MSRLHNLRQRAARAGIYVAPSLTKPGTWDNVSTQVPSIYCGLELTFRQAVHLAYQATLRSTKLTVRTQDRQGMWHTSRCEKVAHPLEPKKARCYCRCLPENKGLVTPGALFRGQAALLPPIPDTQTFPTPAQVAEKLAHVPLTVQVMHPA